MLPFSKKLELPDRHGRPVTIMQPLVEQGHRPFFGWSSSITIRGSRVEIKGKTPQEVSIKLRDLLVLNSMDSDFNTVWTVLNLAWLPRTPAKYRKVTLEEFTNNAVMPSGGDFTGKVPVSDWFPPVIHSLGYSLSTHSEAYDFAKFRSAVEFFATMTDPTSSYRLGDHRLAGTFLECSSALSYKPAHLLKEAQDWFIDTHNAVADIAGLNKLTYDTAKLKYNW